MVQAKSPTAGYLTKTERREPGEHVLNGGRLVVVSGNFAAQVAYALSTDPSAVEAKGSSAVLGFNRHDPSVPVPVWEVGADEWQRLLAISQAGTDVP